MLSFKYLKDDARSSLVVFLVALPLCLGISLASGAPLLAGILAGIVGGLVVGALSGSHTSVSGPAAGLTVIVLTAITTLGDYYAFTLAVFLSGLMQIAMGLLKAGKVGDYFPNSVIKGMLAAIGLILILKQFPHALGYDFDYMGNESFEDMDHKGNTIADLLYSLKGINIGALIISSLCLFSMVFWEKLAKKGLKFFQLFPGALFAVILGVVLNSVVFPSFDLVVSQEHLVSLPIDGFNSFIESLKTPNWSAFSNVQVYKVAATLAIVASLETLLSLEAVDKIDTYKRNSNKDRELLAQGIGNTIAGLIGALPVTSVIVRSSANIASGSRTKLSAVLHGLWMLLAVIFIPHYLELIPLAALAAILIIIGYKLASPTLFKEMKRKGNTQLVPFVITIAAILFTDLLMGIGIGMIVGFFFVLKSNSYQTVVLVQDKDQYLLRFLKDVSFLQKPKVKELLNSIPDESTVAIDGSSNIYVDNDIISLIEEFIEKRKSLSKDVEIIKSTLALSSFFKKEA